MSGDTPVTWSEKAEDDQADAADALSNAAAQLDMVGRGPMSPPKDSRPRDDPKSGNPAPRKPGGAGFDGTVVTEDGATAEVPKHMENEVGGKTLFDNVSVDEEKESEEEPTIYACKKCGETFEGPAAAALKKRHQRKCKGKKKLPTPVDDEAATAQAEFETRLAAHTGRKGAMIDHELRKYKKNTIPNSWDQAKKLDELRKLIAKGAKKLEKKDPVKLVVAWRADESPDAQKYLFEGGRKQASKYAKLNFAGETGFTAGSTMLCNLIADVADGKVKHDIVGARWATEGDWEDDTIIRIARDASGGGHTHAETLGKIETARKDDRATHATRVDATAAEDAAAFQNWCRVAHATPNVGAVWTRYMSRTKNKPYWHNAATGQSTWKDPWAFVETPRVPLPPASDPEARKLAIGATYASRPRGRGLGDLISLDPEVRARAVAARTGGAAADDASRAH